MFALFRWSEIPCQIVGWQQDFPRFKRRMIKKVCRHWSPLVSVNSNAASGDVICQVNCDSLSLGKNKTCFLQSRLPVRFCRRRPCQEERLQWAITMGGYDSQIEKEGFSSSEFNRSFSMDPPKLWRLRTRTESNFSQLVSSCKLGSSRIQPFNWQININ